ncbi:MAG TPA: serine hydrolase domain-containing protein [Gemmatimonadales bacterium]|nr:serine hydrolase domain-containing protein [Gemmatimonadales bacterium]
MRGVRAGGQAELIVGLSLVVCCCAAGQASAPVPADRFVELRRYLDHEVAAGAFPGGVVVVGHRGRVVLSYAFGHYGENDPRPTTDSTIYDLASLTKVVGLTTVTMMLLADGRLDLEAPVGRFLPEYAEGARSQVLVRHLLLHDAGLPDWRPLYREADDPAAALALALGTPLDTIPGARYTYSDLGAIALAQVVERVAGERLDALLERLLFVPLGMRDTRFLPPESWRPRIAPTERDPWRGRVLRGEVHDENAARLGGVSGHAGLFSTGPDLARFAFWLLDLYHGRTPDAGPPVPWPVVRVFTQRFGEPAGSSRALGWDTPSAGSSSGRCLGPEAFGHTGFTGTSIWADPRRELVVILLTNRVHPTRENNLIRRVRPAVADLAVAAVLGPAACPPRVDTVPGPS